MGFSWLYLLVSSTNHGGTSYFMGKIRLLSSNMSRHFCHAELGKAKLIEVTGGFFLGAFMGIEVPGLVTVRELENHHF